MVGGNQVNRYIYSIMKIFEPVSCLRPYIKSFVIVESNNKSSNRLLPDTFVVAAIRLRGNVQFKANNDKICLPIFSISGLRSTFRIAEYESNSANILVQFTEGGAAAFFNLPMHELFESNVALDQFFNPSELRMFEEQLDTRGSMQMKVNFIQQFLISKLRYQKTDLLIANAIEKIKLANGLLSVKKLAENFHLSLDPFEKRFRKIVGATPKQFSDIIRMKALIARAQPSNPLIDSALNAGFFDQSHFIRNFKKFTGQTPGDFFRATTKSSDRTTVSSTYTSD
jgi:AraC-like DNA-binding protein